MATTIRRSVQRFDVGGTLEKPRRTPAGFLELDAYLARTGVYEYPDSSVPGGIRREYRRPEEVFAPASLAAFVGVPVTREHPPGLVTPENAREHQRGTVMVRPWRDGEKLASTVIVYDAELAEEVEKRQRTGTSPGYLCDVEEAPPGTMEADESGREVEIHGYQRNIRPNHLAICEHPRGGDSIRVRLDGLRASSETGSTTPPAGAHPAPPEEAMPDPTTPKLQPLTIAGITGLAEPHVAQAWEAQQRQRQDAESLSAAKLKESESVGLREKARADALAADLEKERAEKQRLDAALKAATSPAAIDARVAERTRVLGVAHRVLGRDFKADGLSEAEVRERVLARLGVKLDGLQGEAREIYVTHRFEEAASRLDAKRRQDMEDMQGMGEDEREDMDEEPRQDMHPEEDGYTEDEEPRQDSREPRRGRPAPQRRQDADPRASYLDSLNSAGLLPSQRPQHPPRR